MIDDYKIAWEAHLKLNWKTALWGSAMLSALGLAACGEKADIKTVANASSPAKSDKPVAVADYLADFRLIDHTGRGNHLYYWADVPAVVIVSQCLECEGSDEAMDKLEVISKEFSDTEIKFYGINSNADERTKVFAHAEAKGWTTPILMDTAQLVGEDLGVSRAGEVFVLEPKKGFKNAYHGPIDGADTYLTAVLKQIAAKEDVTVTSSDPLIGTYIALPERDRPDQAQAVSFTKDVAPILIDNCAECHAEGGIAPWAMTDYNTILGWSPMMKQVIMDDRMPPWGPDTAFRKLHSSRALSNEEKQTIIHWIDAGAPRGDGEDPFLSLEYTVQEWPLGKPDLILEVPEYTIPATGVVEYQYPFAENPLLEDKWLKATSINVGSRAAVHHALTGYMSKIPEGDQASQTSWEFSTGTYAVGEEPMVHPDGSGSQFPAGGAIGFQMHYTPIGKEVIDNTKVGFYFQDKPTYFTRSAVIVDPTITIPAGASDHEEVAYMEWPADATLFGIYPHAHVRLAGMEARLVRTDGTEEMLLSVPRYDFNWQFDYRFEEPIDVKAGDKVITRYWYDNSKRNFSNPDPKAEITWGDQSFEEMMYTRLTYQWVGETTDNMMDETQAKLDSQILFGALDDNIDGKIEAAEINKGRFAQMAAMIPMIDKDGDGALSKEEMSGLSRRMMRSQFDDSSNGDNQGPAPGTTGGNK